MTLLFSFIFSLILTWIAYRLFLPRFRALSLNQSVSEYSLKEFKDKPVTPTMGGLVFIITTTMVSLIMNITHLNSLEFWLVLLTFLGYGLIGFVDDYKIVKSGKNNGLSEKEKLFAQIVLAIIFYLVYSQFGDTSLKLPFIDQPVQLGILYAILILFMFVGASNAVNLTDGMDGLAGGTSFIALLPFIYFAYEANLIALANLLAALAGALLAYLYYNRKPAQIMMGDVGSLSLGGLFAASAMVLKKELLLIIIGIVFVIETLSVIIQLSSVKLFKKRIFPYTPIHYSFTVKGVKEEITVWIFYVIGAIGSLLGFILG